MAGEEEPMKPLAFLLVLLLIGAALAVGVSLPDIQRYLKMRAM